MLRAVLIGLGIVAVLAGIGLMATGHWTGISMLVAGALLLIGTLYERVHYKKPVTRAPGPGWQRTSERFIDDDTGKAITVWIEPKTGERVYVSDD
ncbi:MAG: hypothetical protein ACP5QR_09005 [Rhizomicrobium sp.]